MTAQAHRRLALAVMSPAELLWLVSLALPAAGVANGDVSYGITYLLCGWAGWGHVYGWFGHLAAIPALALTALGSARPWTGTARAALASATGLALLGLGLAFDSVWSFEDIQVVSGFARTGSPITPAEHFEPGFYVWIASFCALALGTMCIALSAWTVSAPPAPSR